MSKYLKAFLYYKGIEFRKTHDLGELIGLACTVDESFMEIIEPGEKLTDYAVSVRYPFLIEEPTFEEAVESIKMAEKIEAFVLNKMKGII